MRRYASRHAGSRRPHSCSCRRRRCCCSSTGRCWWMLSCSWCCPCSGGRSCFSSSSSSCDGYVRAGPTNAHARLAKVERDSPGPAWASLGSSNSPWPSGSSSGPSWGSCQSSANTGSTRPASPWPIGLAVAGQSSAAATAAPAAAMAARALVRLDAAAGHGGCSCRSRAATQ